MNYVSSGNADDKIGKLNLVVQSNLLSFDKNDWTFITSTDKNIDINFPLVNTNDVVF